MVKSSYGFTIDRKPYCGQLFKSDNRLFLTCYLAPVCSYGYVSQIFVGIVLGIALILQKNYPSFFNILNYHFDTGLRTNRHEKAPQFFTERGAFLMYPLLHVVKDAKIIPDSFTECPRTYLKRITAFYMELPPKPMLHIKRS